MAKKDKASRREAQERLAAERARQAAAERRQRTVFISVLTVLGLVIVGVVAWGIAAQSSDSTAEGPTPVAATSENGGIATGATAELAAKDGLPVIDVYSDYQCPHCATFEQQLGPTLTRMAEADEARVIYHSINLIGRQSSGLAVSSSLRSGGAAGCAADADAFLPFHQLAFAQQGPISDGITDDQLLQWGQGAGISGAAYDAFAQCVEDETYVPWVKRVDAESSARGVSGTPMVFLNGDELTPDQRSSVEVFEKTLADAAKS